MAILSEILNLFLNFSTKIFLFNLAFVSRFPLKKGRLWLLVVCGGIFVFLPYFYRLFTEESFYGAFFFKIGWYSFSYLILCALLFLLFYASFKVSEKELLLILCCSYLIQNIIYYFNLISGLSVFWAAVINFLLTAAICVLIVALHKHSLLRFDLNRVKTPIILLFSVSLIVLLTIVSQWLDAFRADIAVQRIGIYLYAGISTVLLLCVLIGIFNGSRLRYEYAVINELYRKAEKQRRISRENIDYINLKVHDMKHQIAAIKQMISRGVGQEEIQDKITALEKTVKVYDDTILTGNSILDTLLAEQKLFCDNNNIALDCVVDGSALDFIDPVDLYVVFGNAIDNAVESVLKLEEANRVIVIAVSKGGGLVNIRIENPYAGQIFFQNGLPHTSKAEEGAHGFGIKSIRHVIQKYGGNMTISAENGRFSLSILIPARKKQGAGQAMPQDDLAEKAIK